MLTAPYMTNYHISIRPEYLDTNCWDSPAFSFSLGALDAPDTLAAGSHYHYERGGCSFTMPSSCSREYGCVQYR